MGLLDWLFGREQPKTETKKMEPEQAAEKPVLPGNLKLHRVKKN